MRLCVKVVVLLSTYLLFVEFSNGQEAAPVEAKPKPGREMDDSSSSPTSSSNSSLPAPASISSPNPTKVKAEQKQSAPAKATKITSVWDKVPPAPPLPRIGYFTIPPKGPGYYTFYDLLLDHYWLKPPRTPFPPIASDPISFYDADYRFLNDPRYREEWDPFNWLKRIHPTEDWMFSVGGEERIRYMNEVDALLTGKNNVFELNRARVYGDLWFQDIFRIYIEMQDSEIANNDLPPASNDVDQADFLNLFCDVKIFDWDAQPAYVRFGRQELYFGSQRLISPSDFPNVRRTFQGVRAFWRGRNWDVDAFWVQPVLMNPYHLDSPDHNQSFTGVWATNRPVKGQTIDLYFLNLDNSNPVALGQNGVRGGYDVSTIGSRYDGDYRQRFLWDFEGMYQFGTYSNQRISAGSITTGVGYGFAEIPTNPQFWLYWDRASGDPHPGVGSVHSTFNQLFPWGHAYFGYLDLVGRENIDDVNMQFVFYPARWITAQVQYHMFRLVSARDALYNASGAPIRLDPTGRAGTNVGDEIDFTVNFHIDPHEDIFVGFSHLFSGPFIQQTGPAGSPSLFYVQYSLKF